MTDTTDRSTADESGLLPTGLQDLLPPDAGHEAATVNRLIDLIGAHGYERVKPPLVEFEDSLLSGAGAGLAQDTFRLMDPESRRMMGIRADMTVQAARLASARLSKAPRPLRLCYAGQVLRVKGDQLRPERQFTQAGAELIGHDSVAADAEIVCLAAEALEGVGVARLSIDLTAPTLVTALLAASGLAAEDRARLRGALDHKDVGALDAAGRDLAPLLRGLVRASGPADRAVAAVADLDLPDSAADDRDRMVALIGLLSERAPDLTLTVDWVEHRGFEYHSGIGFSAFARGVRGELGRGGRYMTDQEPGVGFTVYLDTIMRAIAGPPPARRVFVPVGTPPAEPARLRQQGWVTVAQLIADSDPRGEARRLACSHIWTDDGPRALD